MQRQDILAGMEARLPVTVFASCDLVKAEQAGRVSTGWVSGDTERQVSVSDINWKRIAQFTAKKVQLIQRSTGLLVASTGKLSNLTPPLGSGLTAVPPHPDERARVGYPAKEMK